MSTSDPLDTNESAASRFRLLWESGGAAPPDIFGFLSASGELSASERLAVARIDQRNRWRIGRPISLRTYLKALPDVASRLDLVRVLIDGDRRGRRRAIESVGPVGSGETAPSSSTEEPGEHIRPIRGDDTTISDPLQRARSTSLGSDASIPDAPPSPLTSASDWTLYGRLADGEGSPNSFTLDARHEAAADMESLRRMLDAMHFTLVRKIGAGGMGVVFEVYDQERGEIVALKTMRKVDPQALARFKHEFRSLSDIAHVNLVSLFQLFAVDDHWFFTMELVEGTDFLTYVRGVAGPSARTTREEGGQATRGFQEARLRSALIPLVEGVHYLHTCGKLHRDLKPTNVLVADDGRVVVLDFGLTADLEALERESSAERQIVGTAAHMSPEQSAGREASTASDWYSVGVMLYQALTGRLPFEGSVESVMADKQNHEAPPPDALADELPEDLAALCRDLLDRRPEARPSGPMILDRLHGRVPSAATSDDPNRPARIVGLSRHLEILKSAYQSMKTGRIETVFLYGKSGTGKTTLLRRFLEELGRGRDAVILAGRCHERESLPFKALDSLIDALVRHLKTLPPSVLKPLLPTDVIHLARVFPVLRAIEGVVATADSASEPPDPQEGRLRAFDGASRVAGPDQRREPSRRGDRRPSVGGRRQRGAAGGSPLLARSTRSALRRELPTGRRGEQPVPSSPTSGPEPSGDGREPSRPGRRAPGDQRSARAGLGLAPAQRRHGPAQAHLIACESAGNPQFIKELVKHVQSGTLPETSEPAKRIDLDAVLMTRIRAQSDEGRRLLDLVAVSGRPIDQSLVFQAGGFGPSARVTLLALRSARLIRSKSAESTVVIEIYHDRIRETVLKHITSDQLASCHARLAEAYESAGCGRSRNRRRSSTWSGRDRLRQHIL